MLTIERIDPTDKRQVRRFVDVPFRLYRDCPQWVPPIRGDVALALNRVKHPFYEHSAADFFLAVRDGRDVGRVAALENVNYNRQHGTRTGQFYFFDAAEDDEAAVALFGAVFDWARARGLDAVIGPKGMGPFDGYGLLERGYEHRQMMTMMNYNYPYYRRLVEAQGFVKEVDFVSVYLDAAGFHLDERVHRIAERARRRQNLRVLPLQTKADLRHWAPAIGRAYNQTFVNNWEYVPLTEREIKFVLDQLLLIANPRLLKFIAHGDDVVGFALGFPDVSAALQRAHGHLLPFGLFDLVREMRATRGLAGNGAGILPEFQGIGGNALLYAEMERTVQEFHFEWYELTQVAETATQMRSDLATLGGKPYKNHRVYRKAL
ncbi:hypothetical protein [Promineifilum sp.]|uniref:hypothetical protein n=1 Tax=Promineifilum sp. TaxID=2664178 RepID=UPI0035B3BA70